MVINGGIIRDVVAVGGIKVDSVLVVAAGGVARDNVFAGGIAEVDAVQVAVGIVALDGVVAGAVSKKNTAVVLARGILVTFDDVALNCVADGFRDIDAAIVVGGSGVAIDDVVLRTP